MVVVSFKKRLQIGRMGELYGESQPPPPNLFSKLNISKMTEPILKNEGVLESGRKGLSSGT